ncbi:protein phosphatase [Nocardiopsis gilva YIM 90087]|uniref:Protein phosphatase n=1 Tax=Nocardiopsis gilva YIM 90087 TaxID=1235441 RepID=A0A223SA97_9ACTN|nr:protein-tyrosine phosphatase family protein [Nocardiopsis gilva]ASU85051.1 protein phosphatase [Nocardiopsis gilva YIM 90087]
MTTHWEPTAAGVLRLPSGRLIRGRGLRRPLPTGPTPTFALYLLGHEPPPVAWESQWLKWPDFWLPSDCAVTADALREAWARAATERVEIACNGGYGRTGTALACLAVLDGVQNQEAVAYIREHYSPRAVEMPWQRRFVVRFR